MAAFEGAKIRSTRNAATIVDGSRHDLVAADVVALSMTGLPYQPSSYEWACIGRPEGSTVGGGGTNPWILSAAASATFTVDSDGTDVGLDGAYMVQCTLDKGAPRETRFSVELSRVTGIQVPGLSANRDIRKVGMFESLEDLVSIPGVVAGWSTALNRVIEWVRLWDNKGADIASAAQLPLRPSIRFAKVTGTTQVDFAQVTGRRPGSRFALHFASALTIRHNTAAPPAGYAAFNLPTAANLAVTANSVRNFIYDGSVVHEVGGKVG